MKIIVEADSLIGGQVGIGRFNSNLLRSVLKLDRKNTYVLSAFGDPIRKKVSGFKIKWLWLPRKVYTGLFKKGVRIPYNLLAGPADINLFPNFVKFPTNSGKSVIFVHDLTFLKYPETIEPKNLQYLKKFLPLSVSSADHIVVISESTKNDLMSAYSVSEDKITVIYPALPEGLRDTSSSVTDFKASRNLGRYILFVGTLEPRKNVPNLIKAVEALPVEFSDVALVLVGKRAWGNEEISRAIEGSSLGGRIREFGFVSDEELALLYRGAAVFAFPSLYEGFGIPILEAFAAKVPVVTSNVSSLPEVAGKAAVMVDPQDVESISYGLKKVLGDQKLRERLVQEGRIQLKKFSWESSAKKLINLWEKLK